MDRSPIIWTSKRALALTFAVLASLHCLPASCAYLDEPIQPMPAGPQLDPRKVDLGRKLFVDARFAKDNSVSCASCHDFSHGGADPRPRSVGVGGQLGGANAPSVFNSGLNFRQLWNGGAVSLEDFLDHLISNPKVFDSTWPDVVAKLHQDGALTQQFSALYPEGMTRGSVIDAVATYVRSLTTPSRFDRYLRGDRHAITDDELRGYERFKEYGCVACHQGANVGGNMFQKFGVMGDYFKDRGGETTADLGRFNITQRESDKHVFKVPSLRNVELTAPYFHDGTAPTLEAAVGVMFKYQLGRTAPAEDKALIIKFLKTLTGESQPKLVAAETNGSNAAATQIADEKGRR